MPALLLEEKLVFLQDVTKTEAFFYRRLFFVYLTTATFIVKKKIDKKEGRLFNVNDYKTR